MPPVMVLKFVLGVPMLLILVTLEKQLKGIPIEKASTHFVQCFMSNVGIEKDISFADARNIVRARNPKACVSYTTTLTKSVVSICTQTDSTNSAFVQCSTTPTGNIKARLL